MSAQLEEQDPISLADEAIREGRWTDAIRSYESFVRPGGEAIAQVLHNLIPLYLKARMPSKALGAAEALSFFAPGWVKSWLALSDIRGKLGDWEGALRAVHRAIEVDPECKLAYQGRLFLLSSHATPQYMLSEAQEYAREFLDGQPQCVLPGTRKSGRVRVGYVSGDFRTHVMDRLIEPLLAGHDRARVEVFAYDNTERKDAKSAEMRGYPHVTWREIHGKTDERVCELIVADEIDVLVDLSGITYGNRLEVFAARPGRKQVTWCGFLPTLGSEKVFDAKLVDGASGPQEMYTEKLVKLPTTLAFGPLPGAPEVSSLPYEKNGVITFGVTNGFHKVRSEAIDAWVKILESVPNSRLVIALNGASEHATAIAALRRFGPAQSRVFFAEWQMGAQFPKIFNDIDIALDTFPYGGCATSFDTMWQGVPIVCLDGDRPNGRYAAHFMKGVGAWWFVAKDVEGYVKNAVDAASRPDKLSSLRRDLRPAMKSSALFNIPAWIRAVEDAYLEMAR